MKITNTLKWYLTGLLTLCMVAGCTHKKSGKTGEEKLLTDSILAIYQDSMVESPQRVIDVFSGARLHLQDSLCFFWLLSFESKCYYYLNRMDEALRTNEEVIGYCGRTEDSEVHRELLAEAWNSRGVFWQEQGIRDSARYSLMAAAGILQVIGERKLLPSVYINLADCYMQDGDYSRSGYFYRKALFTADSLGTESRGLFPIYSGLAKLYLELENFVESDLYFDKAEQADSLCTPYERYFFSNTRGNYYYNTKEYGRALDWFRKADLITESFPQPLYKAIIRGNIGEIFLLSRQPDSARFYLDDARRLFGETYGQPDLRYYMDGLYASLALQENDLVYAEQLLSQLYGLQNVNPLYAYYNNRRLEELYAKKGDYRKAYEFKLKAEQFDDSLRNVKVKNNLAEIDFRYRLDTTLLRKDILLMSVRNEMNWWRTVTFAIVLSLLLFGAVIFCLILYRRRKREKRYWAQTAIMNRLRMAVVRNRISPHFIFNVLNIILPAFRQYENLDKPIRLLIKVLRGNLVFSERITVSLKDEIQLVKEYLQLRLLGNPDRIRIVWDLPEIIPDTWLIPAMFIQIPVENAIKYAFEPDDGEACVRIRVEAERQAFSIAIEDNGVGFTFDASIARKGQSTGLGLNILFQTVDILNSRNKNKMSFVIRDRRLPESDKCGTLVIIKIPFEYTFDL